LAQDVVPQFHNSVGKPANASSSTSYRKGLQAEAKAVAFLQRLGYCILKQRYKTPAGEIDIVAIKGTTLHFIEVKRRRSRNQACEAITPKQQQRISQAAEIFLSENSLPFENIHMDAVFITPNHVHYLEDAWFCVNS
jgi:putative endonuclease